MSTINEGGPAFPAGSVRKSRPAHDPGGNWVETDRVQPLHQGLTMRDYFAAQAMQGLACSDTTLWPSGADEADDPPDALFMARTAYLIADAMLEARKEKS